MYRLHIANKNYSSWSLRPWVLMTERQIPFVEQLHPFGSDDDWQAYIAVNPSGLVPSLVANDQLVWDSLAIVEFLAEHHDGIWPAAAAARTWARCACAEMHSGFFALRNTCPMNCGLRITLEETPAALRQDVDRIDALWRDGLDSFGGPFLAGSEFTAVDAFYAPVAFRFQTYGIRPGPGSADYLDRLLAVESMQSWYRQALNEPYREAGHESESVAYGRISADLRKT